MAGFDTRLAEIKYCILKNKTYLVAVVVVVVRCHKGKSGKEAN